MPGLIEAGQKATFYGPNPFSADPVIVADLRIAAADPNVKQIAARLSALTSRWFDFPADERLSDTPLGLARFAVVWTQYVLNFARGYICAAGVAAVSDQRFDGWLGFHEPPISYAALGMAIETINQVAEDRLAQATLAANLQSLWSECRRFHPDYQARVVMEGARASDVPYGPAWGTGRHWRFGWGKNSRVMLESSSVDDSYLGGKMIDTKHGSKIVLANLGYPAPPHTLLESAEEIPQAVEAVGFPCVTKPLDRGGGKGVTAGLKSVEDVQRGFAYARSFSPGPVMLEAFVEGDDHRLLVVDGRFVAAIRRDRPWVVGDGVSTIRQLIEARNQGKSSISHVVSNYVDPIKLDDGVTIHLANHGLSLDDVLAEGRKVTVRSNANLSTGGDCTDVTETTHPHFRTLAESLAATLNIGMAGFDYITPDISRSWKDGGGGFVELNLTPGLDALIVAGWSPPEVGKLALGNGVGRIPIDLVVVPDALAADTERYLETALAFPTRGWASRRQAQLGGAPLALRSARYWSAVDTLLSHRALGSATLLATESEIVQYGLPVDRCARTWLCAVDLTMEWRAVVDRWSETVWQGDQASFREVFAA